MKRALAAVILLVAALPAPAAPRQKVAVFDVRAVQGVQQGTATILTAIIAGDTQSAGYDVLSQADISALLGFERQKKMLGCGEDSSCLAEIGGALGAEYVMSTQVGQIGTRFHLSLQLLDARKGIVVGRVSTFSEATEDALAATAQRAVAQALASARERAATGAPTAVAATATAAAKTAPAKAPPPEPAAAALVAAPASVTATASSGDASGFRRRFYAELRAGYGFGKAPIPTSPGFVGFDGPSFALRGGYTLTPAWAVELGAASRPLRHTQGEQEYTSAGIPYPFPVEDDVRGFQLGAGAVYTLPSVRWLSFAAELGVARYTAKHTVKPPTSWPTTYAPVTETWTGVLPRVGLEARVDFPLRWVTLGLRVGVEAAKATEQAMAQNPFSITPASEPQVAWMESGWFVSIPIDLSVRYVF